MASADAGGEAARKVFISYVAEDREFVHRLKSDLEEHVPGARFLYDLNLPEGASFANTLVSEIRNSDIVLAILSPSYMASAWGEQQLNIATERNLQGRLRLLLVLARPCELKRFARYLPSFNLSDDYQTGLQKLVLQITSARPSLTAGQSSAPAGISTSEVDQEKRELGQAVADFTAEVSHKFVTPVPAPPKRTVAFVAMPLGDRLLSELYEDVVRPTLRALNIECQRGDEVFGSNGVMQDILKSMEQAKVVIADLSGKNPNVTYEVGLGHALNKEVLLLAQSADDIPFDLRHRRVLIYENRPRGARLFAERLKQNLSVILDGNP